MYTTALFTFYFSAPIAEGSIHVAAVVVVVIVIAVIIVAVVIVVDLLGGGSLGSGLTCCRKSCLFHFWWDPFRVFVPSGFGWRLWRSHPFGSIWSFRRLRWPLP